MTDRPDWEGRTGRKWAEEWRRTDRAFAGLTDRLLGRASAQAIDRALDVGCGAGELTLALARGHPRGRIVGLDVSGELISVARERGAHLDNASFEVGDAAEWEAPAFSPDLIVSRHGVMFFDQPVHAFAHLARIAAPGGRLVFSCFRERADNPWASDVAALLPEGALGLADPHAPGPFAFADALRVEALLAEAGWAEMAFEAVDFAYVAGSGPDAVADAREFFLAIGPAAAAAAGLPPDERAAFNGRLQHFLAGRCEDGLIAFPASAWIVTASKA
ncbi:MAG: class I SAM-dependent methyltransferase [Cypionkella sp.]